MTYRIMLLVELTKPGEGLDEPSEEPKMTAAGTEASSDKKQASKDLTKEDKEILMKIRESSKDASEFREKAKAYLEGRYGSK